MCKYNCCSTLTKIEKMMKYKTLILDFDGTLADTKGSIIQSMKFVANSFNIKNVDEKLIESLIGLPLRTTFEKVFLLDEKLIQEATLIYRKHYNEIVIDTISLMLNIKHAIKHSILPKHCLT